MNYSQEDKYIIAADGLRELNYRQKKLLLASVRKANEHRDRYAAALIEAIGEKEYNRLKELIGDRAYLDGAVEELEKRNVECVTVKSELYPESLKNIPTPPLALYLRGNASLLQTQKFAIVGSRKTTAAVLEQCKNISAALSERLTVVTGVAEGADSAAALGAMPSGKLICVLPCGHDFGAVTPIVKEAEKNGLTVSEFPPETPAQRYTFILRNRIIAGLSLGVLVVSAAKKSGALSTANYAADYSRDVFAFPYGLGVPSGEGCNGLIKNGAYLCESENDVFSALGMDCVERVAEELEGDERAIIELIKSEGELHSEIIAKRLNISLADAAATLAMLEIKGLVIRVAGNKYACI